LVGGTNAIAPIITVGKTTAGKPDDRRLDQPHLLDQVLADSIDMGNRRVFPNPDAVINHAAEIFDEMAVDIRRDHA